MFFVGPIRPLHGSAEISCVEQRVLHPQTDSYSALRSASVGWVEPHAKPNIEVWNEPKN
jgi:hypothetical protein